MIGQCGHVIPCTCTLYVWHYAVGCEGDMGMRRQEGNDMAWWHTLIQGETKEEGSKSWTRICQIKVTCNLAYHVYKTNSLFAVYL